MRVAEKSTAYFKVRTAAAVHPDPSPIVSPCAAVDTIRFAALTDDANAIAGIGVAVVALHIVGSAIDRHGRIRLPSGLADFEICPATAINPDPPAVRSPGYAIDTRGFAAPTNQSNAAAGVHRATVEPAIIRGAIHIEVVSPARPVAPRPAWSTVVTCHKFRAAAAVHPDAAPIISPCLAKNARRV